MRHRNHHKPTDVHRSAARQLPAKEDKVAKEKKNREEEVLVEEYLFKRRSDLVVDGCTTSIAGVFEKVPILRQLVLMVKARKEAKRMKKICFEKRVRWATPLVHQRAPATWGDVWKGPKMVIARVPDVGTSKSGPRQGRLIRRSNPTALKEMPPAPVKIKTETPPPVPSDLRTLSDEALEKRAKVINNLTGKANRLEDLAYNALGEVRFARTYERKDQGTYQYAMAYYRIEGVKMILPEDAEDSLEDDPTVADYLGDAIVHDAMTGIAKVVTTNIKNTRSGVKVVSKDGRPTSKLGQTVVTAQRAASEFETCCSCAPHN